MNIFKSKAKQLQSMTDAFSAPQNKQEKPIPTAEEIAVYEQEILYWHNEIEEERIKIFQSYPEDVREQYINELRIRLVREMTERMDKANVVMPNKISQMETKFELSAFFGIRRLIEWRKCKDSIAEKYKTYQRAHYDRCAGTILLNDKDDKDE